MELVLASTPPTNEAFLREVDEELRRDEMMRIWRSYGRWIIAAVVAGLLLFAGYLYWQSRQQVAAGEQGERYDVALTKLGEGKPAEAKAPLAELAKSDVEGYRALALIVEADILLGNSDTKGAAAKFAQIAGDESLPRPFRDVALIRQTSAEMDTLKPEAVIARLQPLAVKDSPWFGSAGEMVAAAQLARGNREAAGKMYGAIARAENVPESIRQRAVQMAGVLGVDAIVEPQGKAEEKKAR